MDCLSMMLLLTDFFLFPLMTSLRVLYWIESLFSESVISFPDMTVLGREMMLDHNTDQAFTSIHQNKRRKQLHRWKSISPIFGRRLQLRSCLLVPSTWLKNITSSISRRAVEEESNKQQLKCIPIPIVAMAKSVVAMGRCPFSSCTVISEILMQYYGGCCIVPL